MENKTTRGTTLEQTDPSIVRVGPITTAAATFNFGEDGGDVQMRSVEPELQLVMGDAYRQCSAARSAVATRISVDVNIGFNGEPSGMEPVTKKLTFPGTLASDKDRDSTLRTFRGSRMCRGDKIINESVTMTIDPLNLTCLTCDREHKIGDKPGPTVVFLGDQNMDPIMTGGCTDESSVVTLRMENSSLA